MPRSKAAQRLSRIDVDPVGSYIRRLGLEFSTTDGVTIGRLPVHPALFSSPGLLRIGILTTLADCVAGFDALSAFEMAWIATSELGIHGPFRPVAGDQVIATARLVKRRKTGGVYQVTMTDRPGDPRHPPIASATVTLSLLGQQNGTKLDSAIAAHVEELAAVSPLQHLSDLIEPVPLDGGGLRLFMTDSVRNSWRVLSGGVSSLLAELAAEERATAVTGGPCVVDGLHLQFLAPGRDGPIEARAEILSVQSLAEDIGQGKVHLSFLLTDRGADHRELVAGTATAHRLLTTGGGR
jgi:acyl-coenzyme A thioesterase PaaI-like protein